MQRLEGSKLLGQFDTQGRSQECTPRSELRLGLHFFCPEARFSITKVVGSGCMQRRITGGQTEIAGHGRHVPTSWSYERERITRRHSDSISALRGTSAE